MGKIHPGLVSLKPINDIDDSVVEKPAEAKNNKNKGAEKLMGEFLKNFNPKLAKTTFKPIGLQALLKQQNKSDVSPTASKKTKHF